MTPVKYRIRVENVKWSKRITIIEFEKPLPRGVMKGLLGFLKRKLGTGGYIDGDSVIVLRGNMARRVPRLIEEYLEARGPWDSTT